MGLTPTLGRSAPTAGFYDQDVVSLARALIGCEIFVDGAGGVIVETEAYEASDPASHSFNGETGRNAPMFGPPGRAYVYRIYGMHWCLNIVGGPIPGAAVLLRALQPTHGLDQMQLRRGLVDDRLLGAGPGRLCQALGITAAHNGLALDAAPFGLVRGGDSAADLLVGTRIGISKAQDRLWRFGLRGSPYLSRPFPLAGSSRALKGRGGRSEQSRPSSKR